MAGQTAAPEMTDDFRGWIRQGVAERARWMVVFADPVDFHDFAVYCADDAALDTLVADQPADPWEPQICGCYSLEGSEAAIAERVLSAWAERDAQARLQEDASPEAIQAQIAGHIEMWFEGMARRTSD